MNEPTTPSAPANGTASGSPSRENRGWLLLMGALFVLLGVIGLGMTVTLTLTSILFLGAFLAVGGVFQAVTALRNRKEKSGGELALELLLALLYVAAGLWVMANPAMASMLATAAIAGLLGGLGFVRILAAFRRRPEPGWGWLLTAGITSLVLAGLILAQWPVSGLWVIGLFIAVEMIFHGWAYIVLALALRRGEGA